MNKLCSPLGDTHNFNQKVELISSAEGFKVQKPRTVFWEWLFLDATSPFRQQSNKIAGCCFDQYLGNIKYELQPLANKGNCTFLSPPEKLQNAKEPSALFQNIGRQLAFATVFGITDLHSENLIIFNAHAQILDIECVLFSAESPADTLLIPNRASNFERSLLYRLLQLSGGFSNKIISEILEGLFQEFDFFLENNLRLIQILSLADLILLKEPIRFLLRPTREYNLNFPKSEVKIPFIKEELEQINRADIPYFFGFIGNQNLFYYKTKNQAAQVGEIQSEQIQKKIQRSFKNPRELLTDERLLKILKQSLIMTASRFLNYGTPIEIKTKNINLIFDGSLLKIITKEFSIESKVKPS